MGRHRFALAKFVAAAVWWALLAVAVLAEAFVVGLVLALPGFSTGGLALGAARNALLAAAIACLLAPVVAWIVTLSRAYMAPLGFALAMLVLGDLFSKTGWAAWFPWSIVPLLIGAVGSHTESIASGSIVVVTVTFLVGIGATIVQLRYADNTVRHAAGMADWWCRCGGSSFGLCSGHRFLEWRGNGGPFRPREESQWMPRPKRTDG